MYLKAGFIAARALSITKNTDACVGDAEMFLL